MAYFHIDSLVIDSQRFPSEREKVAAQEEAHRRGERGEALLVDNALNVIGSAHVYWASKATGRRAVYGQRVTDYQADPTYPDRFSIEMSSRCNYACIMCPRTVLTREQGHMDEALFEKVVDDIDEHGAAMVDLYRLGESTLHPGFERLLGHLGKRKRAFPTSLFSNGGALTESKIDALLASPVTLFGISLNALDAKTHQAITGRGDFERVRALVESFKARKRKRFPLFGVQFLEQDLTADLLPRFVERTIDYVDFIETSMLEDFGAQLKQNTAYIRENLLDTEDVKRAPCQRSLWGRFRIYSSGDVVPCICDINAAHLKMGNVREQSISEIFNSERWKAFRRMHQDGSAARHPLCGPCTDWMIYTGYNRRHRVHLSAKAA